jgi:hypothetical protein
MAIRPMMKSETTHQHLLIPSPRISQTHQERVYSQHSYALLWASSLDGKRQAWDEAREGRATSDEVSWWPSWVDVGAETAVFRGILIAFVSSLGVWGGALSLNLCWITETVGFGMIWGRRWWSFARRRWPSLRSSSTLITADTWGSDESIFSTLLDVVSVSFKQWMLFYRCLLFGVLLTVDCWHIQF